MRVRFDPGAALRSTGRRLLRWGLRCVSYVFMYAGFILLCVPMSTRLSESALMSMKLIDALHGTPVVVALGLLLLLPGVWLRSLHIRQVQAAHDSEAQHIMDALRSDPQAEVEKFYLYLRAFESTGRLRVPLYLRLRKFSLGLFQTLTNDTESYVSRAVRGIAPLIAMGLPGEAVGAGRVRTEEARWTAEVLLLMRRAQAIFLVPSSRPGTLWEMQTLKDEGLLGRVIFIMPPRARGQADILERWESARQALAGLGIEAPAHQPEGLMFEVGPDLKVSNVEPLLLNSVRQVRKSLKRIMGDDPPKGGLFKAIAVADRRARRATFWGWCETARQLSPYALAVLAAVVDAPDVGYDPAESWSTVVDRDQSAKKASDHAAFAFMALQNSARYSAIASSTPVESLDAVQQQLLVRGLPRLDDAALRAYYLAKDAMLQRVTTQTCAAITRGTIEPAAMDIALTYIPPDQVNGFLSARTAAIIAAAEGTPSPPLDPNATETATERFRQLLGADDWRRYERIVQMPGERTDDDLCWLVRAMLGSIARLPDAEAAVFARFLASAGAEPDDAVATQARR